MANGLDWYSGDDVLGSIFQDSPLGDIFNPPAPTEYPNYVMDWNNMGAVDSGAGTDWGQSLAGLIGAIGPIASKFLGAETKEPAQPGYALPSIYKPAREAAMSTLPFMQQLMGVAGGIRSNPEMQALAMQEIQNLLGQRQGPMQIAGQNLMDYIQTKPQLSQYTQQALQLAQEQMGKSPDEQVRDIINLSARGPSQRPLTDADIESLYKVHAERGPAALAQLYAGIGKQEEELVQRWASSIGPMIEQYQKTFGPEGTASYLRSLMELYNLDTTTQIALLSSLGVPITNLAQMFAGLSKEGTRQITAQPSGETGLSSLFGALASNPDLWQTVAGGLGDIIGSIL